MIRDALEILGWYLSPRRLPWFALAEFAIGFGSIIGYQGTGGEGWIVSACLGVGAGTYFAFWHYADFEHRPWTKREKERFEQELWERLEALPAEVRERRTRALEAFAAAHRSSCVDTATAAEAVRRLFTA